MLHAENIVVCYANRAVLRVPNLEISPGQVTVVIGPNASGKSTLMRCLAQALKPQKGNILLDGRDLYSLPAREASRAIAYVPQTNPAPFSFTVSEFVGLGAEVSVTNLASANQKAHKALQALELLPLASRNLNTLSGGEQQRAATARAFAQDTNHLLLDEPTAHLDLRHQIILLRAAWSVAHEASRAVLIVLHDLNLAAQWGDYFVLVCEGGILAQGSAREVLSESLLSQAYQTPIIVERDRQTPRPRIWPVDSAPF